MPRQFNNALEAVEAALNECNRRDEQPYDGIVGTLPEWVPQPFHRDFHFIQVKLLSELKQSEDDIRRYIKVYEQEDSFQSMLSSIPIRVFDYIGPLWKYKRAVEAGREEGLKILLGDKAAEEIAKGKRAAEAQSTRAKKKRGRLDYSDETIADVVKRVEKKHIALSAKQMWTHFWSELESLGLNPEEVIDPSDHNKVAIRYDFRAGRRSISFGWFAALVSRFRSKKKCV